VSRNPRAARINRARSFIHLARCQADACTPWPQVLFVETGFGADQHGQNATKAAVRACRNAIEFNSIPSIAAIVPGGYANMGVRVRASPPRTRAAPLRSPSACLRRAPPASRTARRAETHPPHRRSPWQSRASISTSLTRRLSAPSSRTGRRAPCPAPQRRVRALAALPDSYQGGWPKAGRRTGG
jgi:hypothetical protein